MVFKKTLMLVQLAENFLRKIRKDDYSFMAFMAVTVGVVTGLASVVFIFAIDELQDFLLSLAANRRLFLFIFPALGGLLVGPIIRFVAPEVQGHGVPNVIIAVHLERGKIRPVVALAKILSSILTIGSGGSCGREGPIVQIGAALGSVLSQLLGLSERRTITLLASGAAAGISATFNAPIAGVIFATEVIMKKTGLKEFGAIVIAAVISSVISQHYLGNHPAFAVSNYNFSPAELPFYLIFGFICALAGVFFTRGLSYSEDIFLKLKIDPLFKPAIGGLLCGIFLYFLPEIYGSGFPAITKALSGGFSLKILAALFAAKFIATCFTLGSGGSGGVFAPLLFLGAMLGGAFAKIAAIFFPSVISENNAYAAVGMAAVFAASARSPFTAIILIFEMTRDYSIILPLMLATVAALILAERFSTESIYTAKLKYLGLDAEHIESKNLLENISVRDAMIPEMHLVKVPAYMPIRDLESYFHMKNVKRCIVVDSAGNLYGIVSIKDLYKKPEIIDSGIVADICTKNPLVIRVDDNLEDAALLFGSAPYHTIPVVDSFNRKKILGLLRREDIISAYSNALKNQNVLERFMKSKKIEKAVSAELLEIRIGAKYKCVGKKISEIKLPEKCNIITIFRGKEQIIPDGKTEIQENDTLVILCQNSESVIKAIKE